MFSGGFQGAANQSRKVKAVMIGISASNTHTRSLSLRAVGGSLLLKWLQDGLRVGLGIP